MPYKDLRHYLQVLEEKEKLFRISKEVDKDWELSAVSKLVFRKIPDERRPALLFENVKGFSIPVVTGVLGASRQVYATALETQLNFEEIFRRWSKAQAEPIPPLLAKNGLCQEVVYQGDEVDLFRLPVPVWTVPHDPAPYFTSPYVIARDPDTGQRNVGTYRMQLKGKKKTGIYFGNNLQDLRRIIDKNEKLNRPTPVAVVLGTDPVIGLTSVSKIAFGLDELAVAGGLRGEAIELVTCKTSDLEVPATAEIVLEGEVPPGVREEEGPFGEYAGYMSRGGPSFVINFKCMTTRRNPIFQAFVSQMPPSESSCIRGFGFEVPIYKKLKYDLGLPITDLHLKTAGGSTAFLVISIKKEHEGQPKQAIWGAWAVLPRFAKFAVVVDDDIDVRDSFAVDWAMSFRVQPARDIFIEPHTLSVPLDPSVPIEGPVSDERRALGSKIGIDATKKHDFPPIAFPPKEHVLEVEKRWKEYGLDRIS
ncbi:MAG: UbiD family decarboxylase [Deltaproteobacteria bacterium]|nr:UbiD family decarboxylase [Deltaproteobacteria bacterium]